MEYVRMSNPRSSPIFYLTFSSLLITILLAQFSLAIPHSQNHNKRRHSSYGNSRHGDIGGPTRSQQQQADQSASPTAQRELWLEDFSKDYLNEMQSDGAGGHSGKGSPKGPDGKSGQCPPPFNDLPRDACEATPCASDKECRGDRCCYNGCTFTCMAAMPPPPLVDWRIEPPRKESGKSWLMPAGNESRADDAEYCSTSRLSSNEDQALLCPHGYICHIEYLGNADRGVPNRGRCIPTVHQPSESHKMFQMRSIKSGPNRCIVPGNGIYHNGTRFRYQRHMCQCQQGTVICKVGGRG